MVVGKYGIKCRKFKRVHKVSIEYLVEAGYSMLTVLDYFDEPTIFGKLVGIENLKFGFSRSELIVACNKELGPNDWIEEETEEDEDSTFQSLMQEAPCLIKDDGNRQVSSCEHKPDY